MDKTGYVIYDDEIKNRRKTEVFLYIYLAVVVGLITFYLLGPLGVALTLISFTIIYIRRGSGFNYSPTFRIHEEGLEAVRLKQLYSWREIGWVEIHRSSSGSPVTLAIIKGGNALAIPTNLSNRQTEKVKELLEGRGVRTELK